MSVVRIRQEADISAPADRIFATICDLRAYDRWLPSSQVFRGLTEVSSDPTGPGTTWAEPGPNGVRHGTVTTFEPPTQVTFHQPMTLKPAFLGVIDITVDFTLTPTPGAVHVRREVLIGIPWPLKLIQPLVVRQFRSESGRMLLALKDYAERPTPA